MTTFQIPAREDNRRPIKGWIHTVGGRPFFPERPNPMALKIEDIAHALANLCRFTGHTKEFYSVAQHSVLVAEACPARLRLAGLLHDASEAYTGDVATPIKHLLGQRFAMIEAAVQEAICTRFGLDSGVFDDDELVEADRRLLATEKRDLMNKEPWPWHPMPEPLIDRIVPLTPGEAQGLFLNTWKKLKGTQP